MTAMTPDTEMIEGYLLRETAEGEAQELELEYFADEELLDRIAEVEHDLIESYLSGTLAPDKRDRFEIHYLASLPHRKRLAFARALRALTPPRRQSRWVVPLAAIAATLMLTTLATLWYLQPPLGGDRIPVVTLSAVRVRGEGAAPVAQIGKDASAIKLRLEGDANDARPPFQVLLRTVEGDELWRGTAIAPSGGWAAPRPLIAEVTLPVSGLASGDYVVVLISGAGETRTMRPYYFRLLRR